MGKLVFITGGARSGKSYYGEEYVKKSKQKITYIATMKFIDEEMENRIILHQMRRDNNFETIEAYKNFKDVFDTIKENNIVLFDCLTNMVTNLLLENEVDFEKTSQNDVKNFEESIFREIKSLILAIKNHKGDTVVISNELGMGLVPPYALGRVFRDIAGRVNQTFAKEAEEVYFMISGIPLKIKGDL